MASTRRPPIASTFTAMMVCTHSYWMALPALRELSAEVATCTMHVLSTETLFVGSLLVCAGVMQQQLQQSLWMCICCAEHAV